MIPETPLVCVMGVSAAGKSTVGAALARTMRVPFVDADDLHSDANRAKMAAGIPLADIDRRPWLDAVGEQFAGHRRTGLVMACSALRREYRDRIRAVEPTVVFVHLDGSRELLRQRADARADHFMPAALLESQFATLEPLAQDETGLRADVSAPPGDLVADIAARLRQSLR
ncbi:gluconokinase [Microbacterium sp. zg.B48]|uniref:gluconokinase n=1 Tax=unclassified Microbacterium TaxID=2609290 RepID=UPI00214B4088|nr:MULTISPECIES: gluconokinase [unclassified Microbacterium]MCR2762327.1 gluconokinase [Microbacterium sp. zg.B48]MCR2809667.1 gluconokinase [Microbacterium sp. zg.B185]WIM18011.1 gluconokinase [Microbacterium sp. zg-B185]